MGTLNLTELMGFVADHPAHARALRVAEDLLATGAARSVPGLAADVAGNWPGWVVCVALHGSGAGDAWTAARCTCSPGPNRAARRRRRGPQT